MAKSGDVLTLTVQMDSGVLAVVDSFGVDWIRSQDVMPDLDDATALDYIAQLLTNYNANPMGQRPSDVIGNVADLVQQTGRSTT